jgi:hypothetical protein
VGVAYLLDFGIVQKFQLFSAHPAPPQKFSCASVSVLTDLRKKYAH